MLIDSLFNIFGLEVNYIGGGSGSIAMKPKPCLFTNTCLISDCAILVLLDLDSVVGVSQGWEEIIGPYKVTESNMTIIKSLIWKPALDVYREVVERHSGKIIGAEKII